MQIFKRWWRRWPKVSTAIVVMAPPISGPAIKALTSLLASVRASKQPILIAESCAGDDEPVNTLVQRFVALGVTALPPLRVKGEPMESTYQEYEEAGNDLGQLLTQKVTIENKKLNMPLDVAKAILTRVSGGLYVVTATKGTSRGAMVASWVSQASCKCLGITIAVAKDHAIESLMQVGDSFVLNCLEDGNYGPLMKHFLKHFPPGADSFEGVKWTPTENGAPGVNHTWVSAEMQLASDRCPHFAIPLSRDWPHAKPEIMGNDAPMPQLIASKPIDCQRLQAFASVCQRCSRNAGNQSAFASVAHFQGQPSMNYRTEIEQEERHIVAELGEMEQQAKVLVAQRADLNEQIMEMSLKMGAAEGTSEDLIRGYITLLERLGEIDQERFALDQHRIALLERIALQEKITISSWLKQVMPRIQPIQLGTVERRRGGRGGGRLYLDYAPQSFRRWTSFKGDVLNACDCINDDDDSKCYERSTWNSLKHHSDAGNEGVIRMFVDHILTAMAGVRGDCKISVGPLNAMSDGFRDFAVVTPGGEPCLPVDVKKLNWFRNSEAEPLRDLVEAYEGFRLQGSDALLANSIR
ncbi:unnamed protein product [Calypogeia fissa]